MGTRKELHLAEARAAGAVPPQPRPAHRRTGHRWLGAARWHGDDRRGVERAVRLRTWGYGPTPAGIPGFPGRPRGRSRQAGRPAAGEPPWRAPWRLPAGPP